MANTSSTFDGSEDPLSESGAWEGIVNGNFHLKKLSGELVQNAQLTGANYARYIGQTFSPDQYSRIQYSTKNGAIAFNFGACVRIDHTAVTLYRLWAGSATGLLSLNKVIAGSSSSIIPVTDYPGTGHVPIAGDELELKIYGTTLYYSVFRGGASLLSLKVQDTSISTGQPGIYLESDYGAANSETTNRLDNWFGGDYRFSLFGPRT